MKNTASVTALVLAFSAMAGVAVLSAACGDDDATSSSSSTSGAGTSGTSGTSGAPGTSGGTSGTSGSPGTSSGTSGTPGVTSFAALYAANCKNLKACNEASYTASFADDAACAAYFSGNATAYTAQAKPSQADVDACTAKITANTTCGAATPTECIFKGTGAKDATCNGGSQCTSNTCTYAAATDACGKCADAPAAVTPKAKDAACAAGDICEAGTQCISAKCTTPKEKDDACEAAKVECNFSKGLQCDTGTNKCAPYAYAKLTEKCGLTGGKFVLCAPYAGSCVGAAGAEGTCTAFAKETEACGPASDTTKAQCGAGLKCDSASSKCAKIAECK